MSRKTDLETLFHEAKDDYQRAVDGLLLAREMGEPEIEATFTRLTHERRAEMRRLLDLIEAHSSSCEIEVVDPPDLKLPEPDTSVADALTNKFKMIIFIASSMLSLGWELSLFVR